MIEEKEVQSLDLWNDSQVIYQNILQLPFIIELSQGTLSKKRFTYYMQQDDLYLIDFARALALIAARSTTVVDMSCFIKYAEGAIMGERQLHDHFFKHYEIGPCTEKNDACFAYTHFLISMAATQSIEEAIAAVLPCFWIYRDVGNYIYKHSTPNNSYWKWIETYASEEFSQMVDEALEIAENIYCQSSPLIQATMRKAARQSSILEWKFWDDAYKFI